MPVLRFLAIILGLSLIIGEAYRSWGAGRPVMFWMDDMIMGAMLITAAIMISKDTFHRRAFFAAAWGTNAGMLYGSFFGKVFAPADANAGNFDLGLLTILIGIAFATAVAGMIASIVLQRGRTTD
ncbi:MAG: hypothetical protein AAGF20_10490 [Pseudomonadota bacterium]